jgi:hypothetical protein
LAQIVKGCVPGATERSEYGLPADVWAAGVLAAELVAGGAPFEADTKECTYDRILFEEPTLPAHLSAGAKNFILQVWHASHSRSFDVVKDGEWPNLLVGG